MPSTTLRGPPSGLGYAGPGSAEWPGEGLAGRPPSGPGKAESGTSEWPWAGFVGDRWVAPERLNRGPQGGHAAGSFSYQRCQPQDEMVFRWELSLKAGLHVRGLRRWARVEACAMSLPGRGQQHWSQGKPSIHITIIIRVGNKEVARGGTRNRFPGGGRSVIAPPTTGNSPVRATCVTAAVET